jgi:bifunctional non-homologous end joining protein LigD
MLDELLYALKALGFEAARVGASITEHHATKWIEAHPRPAWAMGYAPTTRSIAMKASPERPIQARLVVQEHIADKAGPHWDMRIVVGDRAISYVYGSSETKIKNGEPFSVGRGRMSLLIKQPDHTAAYADFEGTIPSGYGKGSVTKVVDEKILITKARNDELQFLLGNQKITIFTVPDGGVGPIHQSDGWAMNASVSTTAKTKPLPKGKYAVPHMDRILKLVSSGNYVAQEKIDGSNFTMTISKDGQKNLVSHRISVTGDNIDRRFRIFDPGFYGTLPPDTVLQGEVWHSKGPYMTAGMLNASPMESFLKQKAEGSLKWKAWDIARINGKDVSHLPFKERRRILESVGIKYHIPVAKQYHVGNEKQLKTALADAMRNHGEGLVLKHTDMLYGGEKFPMVKVKPTIIKNARIVGFTEGEGKHQGRLGALTVISLDDHNQRAQVGTGFTDAEREYIWKHRKDFTNQVVEVELMQETETSLRAPRFHRVSPTKSDINWDQWSRVVGE